MRSSAGTRLTEQLLAFGQRRSGEPEVLDVDELIGGMRQLLARPLGSHVELRYAGRPDLWRVEADPSDLEQIVLNLVINARDAVEGEGRIGVAVENVELSDGDADALRVSPGRYVRLSVTDDGCGIDEDTLSRVWEPFFTTKPPNEGSGLGLATVHGIVQQAGGATRISSELGRGTTVSAFLPAAQPPAPEADPGHTPAQPQPQPQPQAQPQPEPEPRHQPEPRPAPAPATSPRHSPNPISGPASCS